MDARIRLLVIERDDATCQLCGRAGDEIDHIVPRSHFGKKRLAEQDHPDNLRCICLACHRRRHG